MKTKSRNFLITSLTMIVMMLAILFSAVTISPLTAYAAGGLNKVDFAITEHWGVCFEQTGSNKLYPITLTNENKLSVPLPTLYRTDTDDYVFDGWFIADTDTKVTQDTVFDGYTVVIDRWTFQEKDANTVISNIKVNNVALEAGMTTAEYNAAVQGATAMVNGAPADAITADSATTYTIYHGLNKSGAPLGAEEEVEVGQDYSIVTKIKLANGYTFDPNITFSSEEGMCASERFLGGADLYTREWNTLATEIEMTINFMNTDYYFEQTPESRKLENYAQYNNWYKVSKLEGLESVTLQYESDGAWAVFINSVPFEALGEEAGGYVTVSPYVDTTKTFRLVANYTQGKVYSEPFEISWARLNPVIESIGIGVIAPQNGYSPEYTVTLSTPVCTLKSENTSTVKNGIKWTGETGELKVSDGVFVNESDYTVSIKLVAQDGYTFANDVTATINANSANVSVVSDTEIKVSYTFPKYEPVVTKYYVSFYYVSSCATGEMPLEWVEAGEYTLPVPGFTPQKGYEFVGWKIKGELKQPGDVITVTDNMLVEARWQNVTSVTIDSVGITIVAPKNGVAPEYTAILTTSKCRIKDAGILWTGETVGELNANSKFNNDNDYTVTVKLVAEDGYKFASGVTAIVNTSNATVSVKSETEIWVSHTFQKPAKHRVQFSTSPSFATGTMNYVDAVEGIYVLPEPVFTPKNGYAFAGWLLNGYIRQPGEQITLTGQITLEARWKSDYTSVGFTVQPSSPAEKKVAQQILYRTTNFTIDPSIAYDSIIAQVYNEETGEWVDSIYDGDNLIVTAGNGAIDSGFGYDQIVFNAKVPGKYTFRIVAKQSGLVVACSENFTVTWVSNAITAQPKGDMIDIGATLKITVKTNFYIASSEIEYYDKTTGTWKLYESVGGFNWNPFSYNFTNNAETSTKFRVKLYESVGNLTATSNEFTVTWTNHKHSYGVAPNGKDGDNHWKECIDPTCPDKQHSICEVTPHKAIGGNCQAEAACACGKMLLGNHIMSNEWTQENGQHFHKCTVAGCTHTDEKVNCSGGTATCTEKAKCATCGEEYGELAAHAHGTEFKSDANNHWNECVCGDKANKASHTDSNNDGKCDTCEYQMSTTPDNPDNPNNTPDNPNNTPDDPSDDKDGLGAGAIVGIVIGSVAVAGVGGFALFWFVIKKKSFADLVAVFKKK